MENKIDVEALRCNLMDADCDEKMIDQFMQLVKEGKVKEQLRLLSCHRCTLLHEVHKKNKKLDCLDFLIYQLKKQAKECNAEELEKGCY